MAEVFELLDSFSAQQFLRSLPPAARRKGELLLRNGSVRELTPQEPGLAYSGHVIDSEPYRVDLYYDPETEWDGECTCPEEFDCGHVFAVMSALLQEHRVATVRSLSSGSTGAASAVAASRSRAESEHCELGRRLAVALGRPLTREEQKFVLKVHNVYLRSTQNRRITMWDFHELGFYFEAPSWAALRIWPAFPANEHEFWLYVANKALEQKQEIPEFMLLVSDLSPIQERLSRWHRTEEIETWKQKLGNLTADTISGGRESEGSTDLRLLVDAQELRLQIQSPGSAEFDDVKRAHFRRLFENYDFGVLNFTTEAAMLWHFFSHLHVRGVSARYSYLDSQSKKLLARLLRTQQLESRIVNKLGQPLARPAKPLHWELLHAADETDDYRLRLVQDDGTPAPVFLCILPGRPALYLSEQAVFAGPGGYDGLLDPAVENRIPAPALEHTSGVTFLRSLRIELPPRISQRVHVLSFQVAIDCQLKQVYPSNAVEECIVNVLAEAPDGHQQTWTGYNWNHSTPAPRGKKSPSAMITVYDRAVMESVPALLEPLNLKPSSYGHGLATRVTKKFPEVFTAWLKTVPSNIVLRLGGELASLASADVAGRVRLDAAEAGIDWFDLRVVLDVSDTTLSPAEIKLLLNARGGYVRLEGKGWRRLRYDLSADEDERLARLGLSPHELSAEPQRLHALQLADEAAKKFLPEQQIEQIHRRVSEIKTRVVPDLPAAVTAQFRPYQIEGFHFLAYLAANRFGGILADDMGLGKTLQTLAWLVWLREQKQAAAKSHGEGPADDQANGAIQCPPSLVVCPKSVMDNWHAEAVRFTPGLRVKTWPARELSAFHERLASADLHVLNYSQLRLLGENVRQLDWLAVILDEGQYIKNPNSQAAQIARTLKTEHRLVLSGTPIENRLLDLWSLMSFAMPGVLGNRAQFGRLHDAKGDPFARRRLSARVRPFVLRRTKVQVAKDLPDRVEEDLFCEIEGEQQTLYRAELKRAQQLLLGIKTQKELAKQQFHFLTSLLRLRQICCDPRLMKADSTAPGAKTEALLDLLEPLMEEGQKVLVFSQFVEMLNLLRPLLEARNWPLFYLAGDTENRGELVQKFQSAEGAATFLISLKAGGFGLNLTAASYVVLFDPWWNPAVENQAIDRTHRIGQSNKVIAYRLLIKNSIEEKIRELQKHKKALAEDVLGEEKFAQSLTLEDLHFLFAD